MKYGIQVDLGYLVKQPWAAREQAHSPCSRFAAGAASLSESGEAHSGCNVENISFGLTVCSERKAVTAAIQAGCRKLSGIVIVADTETPVVPCGACRQLPAEFHPALPIYAVGRGGASHLWLLSELLPSPFEGITVG
jgi:cytidine deaminase